MTKPVKPPKPPKPPKNRYVVRASPDPTHEALRSELLAQDARLDALEARIDALENLAT